MRPVSALGTLGKHLTIPLRFLDSTLPAMDQIRFDFISGGLFLWLALKERAAARLNAILTAKDETTEEEKNSGRNSAKTTCSRQLTSENHHISQGIW